VVGGGGCPLGPREKTRRVRERFLQSSTAVHFASNSRDARDWMGKDVKVMVHRVYKPTPNGSNPALVFVSSCFSDTTCTGDGVGPTLALFTSLLGN
jgi:hypothetical protein